MTSPSETPPSAASPQAGPPSSPDLMHNHPGEHDQSHLDWPALHAEDSVAGAKIGRLLAGFFLLLLALMIATTVWTFWNQNLSSDPHATKNVIEPGSP